MSFELNKQIFTLIHPDDIIPKDDVIPKDEDDISKKVFTLIHPDELIKSNSKHIIKTPKPKDTKLKPNLKPKEDMCVNKEIEILYTYMKKLLLNGK